MYSYCPSSLSARSARSTALGCNWRYRYHCLRNKKDDMVEKCLEFSWMEKGKCAVYDTEAKQIDAWPCSITRGVCPQEEYQSQDVMSYSACVPLLHSTNSTDGRNTHEASNNNNTDVGGTAQSLVIAIVTSLAVIGIVVVFSAIMYWCWRRKKNHGEDEERTEPLMMMEGNFRKYEELEEETNNLLHLKKEEEHLKYFECKGESPRHMLETIKMHLHRNANVFIIGKPGSGKTTLAWTVCKQMHGESFGYQKWFVKTSISTQNFPDKEEMKLILLLDGRFESAWTTERTVEKILVELDEMRNNLPSKQMLTIATISREAYRRISKYGCISTLKPMEIIDLDSKQNTWTFVEMAKVLETYDISIKNVEGTEESKVLSQIQLQKIYDRFNYHNSYLRSLYLVPNIGFPLVVYLMSLNSSFLGNINFIRKPIEHILKSIKQLRYSSEHTDKNKYCTIVYASLNFGYVDKDNIDHDLLTKIGIQHDHIGVQIDSDFYVLRKITDTVYGFLHESLLRAFFVAYGSQYMGFVIDNCPLQVLLEYSVSYRDRDDRMSYLNIGGMCYEKALIRRIKDEKINIRHHRLWEQRRFQEMYKMYMRVNVQENMQREKN